MVVRSFHVWSRALPRPPCDTVSHRDPERKEAEAARAVEAFVGLSAVLRSSDTAISTTYRLAHASTAALTDLAGNVVTDVARR
jgi:hypothetical protein